MASSGEKSLAAGHISGFQIDPMKKLFALLLASILVISLFAGCTATNEAPKKETSEKTDGMSMDTEKPTITFVHGYYHDESEWPAAAQMRQIYQDFADMHKDEFTFIAVPDESGTEGIQDSSTIKSKSKTLSVLLRATPLNLASLLHLFTAFAAARCSD